MAAKKRTKRTKKSTRARKRAPTKRRVAKRRRRIGADLVVHRDREGGRGRYVVVAHGKKGRTWLNKALKTRRKSSAHGTTKKVAIAMRAAKRAGLRIGGW